jgi:hypothetical protein
VEARRTNLYPPEFLDKLNEMKRNNNKNKSKRCKFDLVLQHKVNDHFPSLTGPILFMSKQHASAFWKRFIKKHTNTAIVKCEINQIMGQNSLHSHRVPDG